MRRRTSISQKLPAQLESKLEPFYKECARIRRIGKYPLSLIGNMDETPMYFDMVPLKTIAQKGKKSVTIRSSGSEKRHITVVLAVTADGGILPPMIIFKGKTDRTIKNLVVPTGFVVATQEKAWMDEELMLIWLKDVWLRYTEQKQTELGFLRSFLTLDAFSAHHTDPVKEEMFANSTDPVKVPEGCTSKSQPLDVSINRPFKLVLGECWEKYVLSIIDTLSPDMISDPTYKLPAPSRQHIVDWVLEGYNYLLLKKDVIKKSFDVCGITTTGSSLMRNDEVLRKIMDKANEDLQQDDNDDDNDDPFQDVLSSFEI